MIYWDGARVLGVLAMSRAIGMSLITRFRLTTFEFMLQFEVLIDLLFYYSQEITI